MEILVFFKGLLVGILASAPLGPVGLLCVNRTVNGGKSHGFVSGLGAATADTSYAAIAAFGLHYVAPFIKGHEAIFRTGSAVFLIVFGIWYLLKDHSFKMSTRDGATYLAHYTTTLVFTLTNPITILAFAAMFSLFGLGEHVHFRQTALTVVCGVFTGACLWWLLISFVSARLRKRLQHPNFALINRIIGGFFIVSGLGIILLIAFHVIR